MKLFDITCLPYMIDKVFLISQGYPTQLDLEKATITELYELFYGLTIESVNPHPLFDSNYMLEVFGKDWLMKYINQNKDYIMPNKLIDKSFIASQSYSNKSMHLDVFTKRNETLNIDIDLQAYSRELAQEEIKFHHQFSDYCYRSNYKLLKKSDYKNLFE